MNTTQTESVFYRDGDTYVPTQLARGPWRADAQHGGAPAGLVGALAEAAVAKEPGWALVRLTLELLRPAPIAPLSVSVEPGTGRSVRRVGVTLIRADAKPVARATVLMIRAGERDIDAQADGVPFALPGDCTQSIRIPGMPEVRSFYYTAMETRVAAGHVAEPGPAATWFRLTVPLLAGTPTTPAMRALAAADFGNGISWILPLDRYVFTNPDLTVYLHRPPAGEWVGLDSATHAQATGIGLAHSVLYDEYGRIGVAQQSLLIQQR